MNSVLIQKRKIVHLHVLRAIVGMIRTTTAFVVIFSALMLVSNWSAYKNIVLDWFGANVITTSVTNQTLHPVKPFLSWSEKNDPRSFFSLEALGELFPPDMRLEIPSLFSGTIPVKNVEKQDFDFKNYYSSENEIQKALRDGVVHYPFTATPDQYGNVFITGHSSYYPWDKGHYKDIFALLHKLEVGDEYVLYFGEKKYIYRVTDHFEVEPDDISVLNQPVDKKISTLMTCTPVGTTLRRLIVRGELQ